MAALSPAQRELVEKVYFEEQNIHTLGEEGEFILTLLAAYAEEEAEMLRTGNLLLQKTYVTDPITKIKKKNRGQQQRYFVEGSHEAILDKETYEKVLAERARRLEGHICGMGHYPFSSRITCGRCGKHFLRHPWYKDKYEWVCRTHRVKGNAYCTMLGIAEETLERLTAEVMDIAEFDGGLFREKVAEIFVPEDDKLVYRFFDGRTVTKTWIRPRKGPRGGGKEGEA